MKRRVGNILVAAVVASFLMTTSAAWADCGSVPFYSPFIAVIDQSEQNEATMIKFDPLSVSVFEPQQRGIILWNGEEEILLLSTDQRATRKSAVLEVIPLPAEPTVRLGSFQTFENAQRLMVEKRMWVFAHGNVSPDMAKVPEQAGKITFQEKLGAHDLAVAQVLKTEGFVEFVQNYLRERYQTPDAPIRAEFLKIIQSYLDEGFKWFAFDVITLDGTTKSREPIEYRFSSSCVFYPLRISTLEQGQTKVDLLVFSAKGVKSTAALASKYLDQESPLSVSVADVEGLEKGWKGFFPASPDLVMDQVKIEGESPKLVADVTMK
ncbi:MAG: DUF2330 domain-containing protein [bacterium]